jgi:predicted NUDIX family NTP pyrophosphohydrolase
MSKNVKSIKRHAFAILLYRVNTKGKVEVFLAQANGPRYWKRQQENRWGLPKGRSEIGETPFASASREFHEEIGIPLPSGRYRFFMQHVRPKARRQVTVFAAQVTLAQNIVFGGSNFQTKEWPPKSGASITYAEIVDAQWFPIKAAMSMVLPGQRPILKKLKKDVKKR